MFIVFSIDKHCVEEDAMMSGEDMNYMLLVLNFVMQPHHAAVLFVGSAREATILVPSPTSFHTIKE